MLDLTILAGNWQQSPRVWTEGNFNNDQVVDLLDLTLLAGNWEAGQRQVVPESVVLLLLILGFYVLPRAYRDKSGC
jgi:hypothetical protein